MSASESELVSVEVVNLPHPGGRPSKYDPQFCEVAYQLYVGGATDAEVAKVLEVNPATLYRWVAEHEEFRNTQRLGKVAADERVERSLYHRATGYSHPAVKIFCDPKTGKNSLIEYIEHYPPDTTACIFWLKNRRPNEWKDKHEVAITDDRAAAKQILTDWLQDNKDNPSATVEEGIKRLSERIPEIAKYGPELASEMVQ